MPSLMKETLGVILIVLWLAFFMMIGIGVHWLVTRGACVQRTNATVSICTAWESDLATPEEKAAWRRWKKEHPGQSLD